MSVGKSWHEVSKESACKMRLLASLPSTEYKLIFNLEWVQFHMHGRYILGGMLN